MLVEEELIFVKNNLTRKVWIFPRYSLNVLMTKYKAKRYVVFSGRTIYKE